MSGRRPSPAQPFRRGPSPARNPEHGVRREFEALGLPFGQRAAVFEEGLAVLRSLWTTGKVTHHGEYYDFDDVSFYSGTEMGPLMPVQQPPPTWVISNIRLTGDLAPEVAKRRMRDACARVIKYGDGWMTCCRATHPEEVAEQITELRKAAADLGEDFTRYTVSYQVTMNIGDSAEQAASAFGEYIASYYPELSKSVDRALADTLFPMVPPRNLHQAMVTSDQIIIMTNLEWANRFAHVPAVKESVANRARIGSIEEGFGRWPISVADIEQTIGNAKKAIARLEGKKRVRVTSPAGTDVVVSIERRPGAGRGSWWRSRRSAGTPRPWATRCSSRAPRPRTCRTPSRNSPTSSAAAA